MNLRDTLERLVWTVVAAFVGNLAAGAFFDVDALQAAAMAAAAAAVNFITIVARTRLAALPDPGAGLPNLPTGDGGYGLVEIGLFLVLIALSLLLLNRAGWL